MAATTAHIFFGNAHPNEGGLRIIDTLALTEGSRPAWVLRPSEVSFRGVAEYVWIPTLQAMLDDAMLLAACVLFADQGVQNALKRLCGYATPRRLELYDIGEKDRAELYELCRASTLFTKAVIVPYSGSTLLRNLQSLRSYNMEIELCYPVFNKTWSSQPPRFVEKGSIPV